MAAHTQTDSIEEIRLHSDIVDVIQRYVPLKKAGRLFKACCPFHKEKTPSFQVNPDKQFYYCFGCHAGGDVFKFVQQYENVEFLEAVQILADRAGITFERRKKGGGERATQRTDLYRVHEQLAAWYHANLKNDAAAEKARAYLAERELTAAIDPFQLGYALPQANALARWADQENIPRPLLEQAGVLLPSDRGGAPYDRFKGRLMFPIRNEQGRIVGFSGRIMDASSPAKYVNSPETPLFKKGRLLYGLDRARQAMVDARQALVCEGQIDVIRCQLAGLTHTVAPQGTALTEGHAALLKRYADEIVLVFDADNAGQTAALRAVEPLFGEGLSVRVAQLPVGEDPDSLIRQQGEAAFAELIKQAPDLITFQINALSAQGELDSAAGRTRSVRAVLETIRLAPSAVQREDYIKIAARLLKASPDALGQDLQKMGRAQTAPPASPSRPATAPQDYPLPEITLIELMISHPEVLDLVNEFVPPEAITHPVCRTIMETIMRIPDPGERALLTYLTDQADAVQQLAARIQMSARSVNSDEVSCQHAAQDLILNLRIRMLDRRIRRCRQQLTEETDAAEARTIENERIQLVILKKRLEALWIAKRWDDAVPILELDD